MDSREIANHTWRITLADGSGLKIFTLRLSLGQRESLIRLCPANERRQVHGLGDERRRGRQFLEMITDSFPCLSCLWKDERDPPTPASLHPHRAYAYCVTTADPPRHQPPSEAHIGLFLITLALCSFTFSPVLWQIRFTLSINNFLRSSVLSLNFSFSFCCSALLWNWGSHL